jgi:hypothetical protein
MMLNTLKQYDNLTANAMLAHTAFFLDNDPVLSTLKPIENEEAIRERLFNEICRKLNIPSVLGNERIVIDYLDDEIEKSTQISPKEQKAVLTRLSDKGDLPTDLYNVKLDDNTKVIGVKEPLIKETIKHPDMVYNFSADASKVSVFAKFYRDKFSFNNFFLLIIGERSGLDFIVNQVWKLYNDMLSNKEAGALDLLKAFVNNFGVDVEFKGEVSRFFLSAIAKDEKEFHVRVDGNKLKKSKAGQPEFITFNYINRASKSDKNIFLFFVVDLQKYKKYLSSHRQSKE